ncbi:MAG: serine hydrolase domain-containing protein [Bacteroidales bacterium]|jgi:CubicO group peptidase (beta-lactamase class C family)|nr:serine hydrolase domain-containing protein [Bacteroidales bacterium]
MKANPIWLFLFLLGCFIAGTTQSQTSANFQEKLEKIDSVLTTLIPGVEPGLSIAITIGDQIVFERYYGFANIPEKEKLDASHVLGIASMSKQFTGMAVLFLEEEGKLDLGDDIKKYLPDLPLDGRDITIAQLLSHTSGLPEITRNDHFMSSIVEKHTISGIIDMAFEGDFTAYPGEEWRYCNTGYTIIAALIEELSNKRFSAYLQDRIFGPLEMKSTYACDYEHDADNAVQRYIPDSSAYIHAAVMHFSNLIGGGSVVSNIHDMAIWGIALTSGNKLPPNFQTIWKSNKLNSGEETGYGLGMGTNSIEGKTYYYHPGMGDGMNSVNLIFPQEKISITVIRNVSTPEVKSMEAALIAAQYLLF